MVKMTILICILLWGISGNTGEFPKFPQTFMLSQSPPRPCNFGDGENWGLGPRFPSLVYTPKNVHFNQTSEKTNQRTKLDFVNEL